MVKKYEPEKIEPFWQKYWQKHGFFIASDENLKPKCYILVEFPYPSGTGLHVGHVRSYTALDVMARQKRMQGHNVMYPIGWDAFGLPTENYAIKNKIHPAKATKQNITTFKKQIHSLGLSFDWSREINTTDPKYYKWTQWIFLQLFKHGLAYKKKMPINWCPSCKIGLANEEVVDGKCERCGAGTEKREKEQWLLAITKYADRLIEDLKIVDYLPKIAIQQINWIGRKEGINIFYPVEIAGAPSGVTLETFTCYPETNFGATFIVIAPEHPLVDKITSPEQRAAVAEYLAEAAQRTEVERSAADKEKTGVFTGAYAVNRLTGEKLPIWVADFVLAHFGTGVVVGVPAHDVRDFLFAQKYGLPVKRVIKSVSSDDSPVTMLEQVTEDGTMMNSSFLDGLDAQTQAKTKIMKYLEQQGWGKKTVTYSLRDWVFSRQHYWGEPIPIVHCAKCGVVTVPEDQLPVELPAVEHYEPTDTGESPLAKIKEWVETKCPQCGGAAKRETDTMPNWAGSSWYFLRYCDPQNNGVLAAKEKLVHWLPVDLYNGGMEHTTLHLLYSRFWHKFLFDIGVVPQPEPYARRRSHGMILASDGRKMSKSFGNVINPDDVIRKFGADTMRLYEMFMGPYDEAISWDEHGVKGCHRFLERVWRLAYSISREEVTFKVVPPSALVDLERVVHQTIKKVSQDIEAMKFNTAVAQLMICLNAFEKAVKGGSRYSKKLLEKYILLLSVFAPHICEEIWKNLGYGTTITLEKWPKWDEDKIKETSITIAVQINGKLRDTVNVAANASEEEVKKTTLNSKKIQKYVKGKKVVKIIVVPKRIVNVVAK